MPSIDDSDDIPPVTLADIYDVLDIGDDERVSICHKGADGVWHTEIHARANASDAVGGLRGDVYFGVNPVNVPVGAKGRRGREDNVTRVVALYADLDVKPGGCPDLQTAYQIIDEVSAVLSTRPVVVIFSGHGLQPIWAVQDCTCVEGRPLLRRFGRLVKVVAHRRNVVVDNVFELARVLRVPGTLNHKDDTPVQTVVILDTGAPMTVAEISERLDEFGVYEEPNDRGVPRDPVSDAHTWAYGGRWLREDHDASLGDRHPTQRTAPDDDVESRSPGMHVAARLLPG